uniref:Solute carrier family 2, facilitated glucose transporter member 8 n=1 Tax=Latimeria chalumnae TaxID=7897 RepID=H3AT68_LATCH
IQSPLRSGSINYQTFPAENPQDVQQNHNRSVSNKKLYVAVFSAVLGNFSFGFSMVYSSPTIATLNQTSDPNLHMDTGQSSIFGSTFTLGAAVGGLSSMWLNDRLGRKLTIMVSAVPSVLGYAIMGSAQRVWMLYLGRLLTGFAGGLTASSIPVYIAEISHPGVRGVLGACPQIMAVFGSLLLYGLGVKLHWRWLAVTGEIPILLMIVLLCFMPESPRFLLSKERGVEALRSLSWLRGPNANCRFEYQQIEESLSSQASQITLMDMTEPFFYKPILITVTMRLLQQLTGITPLLVYLETIFNKTHVILKGKYAAVVVGAVRLVSVLIAAVLMDKAGRKILLFISGTIMFLSMLSMGLYTKIETDQDSTTQHLIDSPSLITLIPLISIMLFIFDTGYAMGWGPITWLLMSEILPLKARGVASGLCVSVSWITAFILTELFMNIVDTTGLYVPFLFFSGVCLANLIFTGLCIFETKGKSLEQIEAHFRNDSAASLG